MNQFINWLLSFFKKAKNNNIEVFSVEQKLNERNKRYLSKFQKSKRYRKTPTEKIFRCHKQNT